VPAAVIRPSHLEAQVRAAGFELQLQTRRWWASWPLDFAFLRAALVPLWELLDVPATGPIEAKP